MTKRGLIEALEGLSDDAPIFRQDNDEGPLEATAVSVRTFYFVVDGNSEYSRELWTYGDHSSTAVIKKTSLGAVIE